MAIEKDTKIGIVAGGMVLIGGVCFLAGYMSGSNKVTKQIATIAVTAADTATKMNRPMLFRLATSGGDVYGNILPYATNEIAKTASQIF